MDFEDFITNFQRRVEQRMKDFEKVLVESQRDVSKKIQEPAAANAYNRGSAALGRTPSQHSLVLETSATHPVGTAGYAPEEKTEIRRRKPPKRGPMQRILS
ncbi:hypothetical protein [Corynebacterium caspium]|uniref:hypothetical protein n=1 Tax=Corynebacterium caspium TaxID=234828 RepID=UPI000381932C|nr:hypothetical protein [Corynebacterium caspium]WKD59800.1 hypothetical protein CCASP_07105 [Corynebacterium caspium DSM 44850]